jgi:hypothetical protein
MADDDRELMAALDKLGIVEDAIYAAAADDIDKGLEKTTEDVVALWQDISPTDTGFYRSDLYVTEIEDEHGHPARRITDMAEYAHIIEYGSEYVQPHGVRAKVFQAFDGEGKYLVD